MSSESLSGTVAQLEASSKTLEWASPDLLTIKIEHDLEVIISEVLHFFGEDQTMAIALAGGLGRGEPTRLRRGEQGNERYMLLSDYDILVAVRNPILDGRSILLRRSLSEKLGIETEIGANTPAALTRLPRTVATYELAHYRCLWGSDELLKSYVPKVNPAFLPSSEGSRLFFNRGAGLIRALRCYQEDLQPLGISEDAFLVSQCIKAILAAGDAFLLLEHSYHFSYGEKKERLLRAYVPDDLKYWYEWATKFKTEPQPPLFEGQDLLGWYNEIVRLFESWHRQFEERRSQKAWTSWQSFARRQLYLTLHRPQTYWKTLQLNVRTFGVPKRAAPLLLWTYCLPIETRLRAAMPLILYSSISPSEIYRDLLSILFNTTTVEITDGRFLASVAKRFVELWLLYLG